jgi:4,5-DOPA dioxygenase extradiol
MDRRTALQLLSMAPFGTALALSELREIARELPVTPQMPMLFLGHGSPMNAIGSNEFTRGWRSMAANLPRPSAILCISAHWETQGTFVTSMRAPRTIHDFGGFPQELFDVRYPAPGSPDLAQLTQQLVTSRHIGEDHQWGLDHGAWSVIMHLYPKADVPVVQLSLDRSLRPEQHHALARELAPLRRRGVLILGSGNIVHNLRMLDWQKPEGAHDWALEANTVITRHILGDATPLLNYHTMGKAVQLAVPTPEHFLPLLYILGLHGKGEPISLFNNTTTMGSISMASVFVGG